jgi:hypothetical protein
MIQYTLKCDQDHRFDSWFQNAAAFDKLKASGMVACAVCGSPNVDKALMAPRVSVSRDAPDTAKDAQNQPDTPTTGALSTPRHPAEQALAELKKRIEATSEYVGMNFAAEARRIHSGDSPERAIYGEARPDEARKLIEDGVPVAPLPFMPGRKSN